MPQLAIMGGPPVYTGSWPAWPRMGPRTVPRVVDALTSGRWAVSGARTDREPLDRVFARRFARYLGVRHCLPVDHGSNALVAALLGVGVQPGEEVIVPGLTWVATASAVLRIGATPVLADVEPSTLCLSPRAAAAAITGRTRAILPVHLYSAMADMTRLCQVAERAGLVLVEDAAQAHGAEWGGRRAGSIGVAGAFSMQQGKPLTAGEGGAVVTSRDDVASSVELLRGDGRRYNSSRVRDRPDLEEVGSPMGWNMHLSEVQSALLLDGLSRLPRETAKRERSAALLDRQLAELGCCEPIRPHPENNRRAFYHYVLRLRMSEFAGASLSAIGDAISAELGTWIHPTYPPLDRHRLYRPDLAHALGAPADVRLRAAPGGFDLPVAVVEAGRSLVLHHSALLGTERHTTAVVEAVRKVQALSPQLRRPSDRNGAEAWQAGQRVAVAN